MMVRSSEIALRRFFAGGGERKGVREMVGIVLNAILVIVLAVLLILHVKWNKPKKK